MTELLDALDRTRSPYREGGTHSFLADLYRAQVGGNVQCRGRLDLHQRSLQLRASDTTVAQGVVPPSFLEGQFQAIRHARSSLSDTVLRVPIADASPLLLGAQDAGAVVVPQTAELAPPAEGDFTTGALLVITPTTLTGKVPVSRQLLDGSSPTVDALLAADAAGALGAALDLLVAEAIDAAAKVVTVPASGDILDDLVTAIVALREADTVPRVLFVSNLDFGALASQRDDNGQPLIRIGAWNFPALSMTAAGEYGHISGEALGLGIVPSKAVPVGRLWALDPADVLLFVSEQRHLRFTEARGPQGVELASWAYAAAAIGRHHACVAEVASGVTPRQDQGDDLQTNDKKAK